MRQAVSSPTPLKKQRRRAAFTRLLVTFFILVLLFIGLGFVSRIDGLVIHKVSVHGTKVLDNEAVVDVAAAYLRSRVAFVYARGNIFLYSQKELSAFLKREFPRIFSITSMKRDHTMLSINLEERQAAFTWCGEEPPLFANRFVKRECYFMDQEGFVFDHAPYFTPGVYVTFYGGIASPASPIGDTIGIKNSILEYGTLSKNLADLGLPLHAIVIHADGQHALLLDLPSDTGDFIKILFNEDTVLTDLLSTITATLQEATFAKEWHVHPHDLEYIDTRFGNKVFYKFRNEN